MLLLHLYRRAEQVGMSNDGSVLFPLNQQHIADALGLSLVHTRTHFAGWRRLDCTAFRQQAQRAQSEGIAANRRLLSDRCAACRWFDLRRRHRGGVVQTDRPRRSATVAIRPQASCRIAGR